MQEQGSEGIDIVIPVYNAYEFLLRCLDRLYCNTTLPYRLILVDDASPDMRVRDHLRNLQQQEHPAALREICIIENEKNIGFVQSVNKGIARGKNHVVLLNTDTEVPYRWLERLIKPILDNPRTASVTPFSNSAEICSFPEPFQDNAFIEGLTLEELDHIFLLCAGVEIEIPTGVGFCMALNRDCLVKIGLFDPVYGKGYGEENDWCCRALAAGYHHVMATNLFVYHQHGISFLRQDMSREVQIARNLQIVTSRYPDYLERVHEFVRRDPAKRIRQRIWASVQRKLEQKRKAGGRK